MWYLRFGHDSLRWIKGCGGLVLPIEGSVARMIRHE